MRLAVDFHHNRAVRYRLQHPDKAPPPIDGQLQLGEDPLADESLEMPARAQNPIESRRGDFQRVMALDRILALEHLAHRMTRTRAVIDSDAGVRILRWGIDENPQHTAAPLARKLDVHQFITQRLDRRL